MSQSTILLVDDEPANLAILSQILSPMFRVLATKTGEQALQNAVKDPGPDLILLDIMMPGMDGYTVLSRLQENEKTRDIPVIFVTALDESTDEEHGLKLGAVDYITKPIRPAIVKARVKAHLEIKHSRDSLKNQNALLEAKIARRMRDNIMVQDISLCALAGLAEAQGSYMDNHIIRTKAYVEALVRKLKSNSLFFHGMDEAHLAQIINAVPLHDIGKVGIPDHILLKTGQLSSEEWEIMKGHCRIGGEAIANAMEKARIANPDPEFEIRPEALAFLEVARDMATFHHEKWDGTGYPEGLSGSSIPLPARLMALADVFDTLTTARANNKSWSVEDAARLILEQKGKHFDPDIVDAFEAILDTFKNIHQTLSDSKFRKLP